ncbi:superfamily I helicase [Cryptosporidium sp. chipmunk genotype I]|uniref:superfamily I helicase n=1 Tax=Cryptosporidium sp. chipmunk genotype I TaxID=1280935 RepID=UPI003519E355|nr:superfamily I helicase [Cryptosporidium sp. chipmunk genotype I]
MNKKVEIITQNPHGIIPCDKDPDIYNVCSFSTDHRIVDMLLFECTCPSKDKSFCSHIRAVSKKFQLRYNREIFNIFLILNDINTKNSFASCYDKAENHFNLFLKSINRFFHFNNFIENQDIFSTEAKQRYKRVLYAVLKSLSSISWRYHLIKTKDDSFINSINCANNARNSIEVDSLLDSINFSLSNINRNDYSTIIDFLQAIESNSLKKIGIFNKTSIFYILEKILSGTIILNSNKEILIRGILEFFSSNSIYLQFENEKLEKKSNRFDCKFLHSIFKTIKRYWNRIDPRFVKESINFILIDEFGLDLDFLGISDEDIARETSLVKGSLRQNTGVIDLLSLKINQIDSLVSSSINSPNDSFFQDSLINIICSAPILIDLYDHLFWYSANNHVRYGELVDFLESNIDNRILSHFYFVKFSKNGNKAKSTNSRANNTQICIYKVLKPNNEKYSATHVYYSLMIDSICEYDAIKTLNYFMGACIQENGIENFIKLFSKEILITDISSRICKSFNIIDFFSCILRICPPVLYVDLWDYLLTTILSALSIDKEQFIISLSEDLTKNNSIFELNKFIHIIPPKIRRDFYAKFYFNPLNLSEFTENEDNLEENENKLVKLPTNIDFSFEDSSCEHCSSYKPLNLIDCKSFIISIQKKRFGISEKIHDRDYSQIIQNYTRIINQSCENLSIKLYTKINHFIFELIQNADDNYYCSCTGRIPTIIFAFQKNGVLVINNEIGFTEKDVSSICDIGNSSKISSEKKIGCFGIGFKSVFSITNTPFIFSNGYCFKFNLNSEHGSYIFPEWVDDELNDLISLHKFYNEYDIEISSYRTKFWLPYKENIDFKEIKLDENMILFTNKLRRIKLVTENRVLLITKCEKLISSDVMLVNIIKDIIYDLRNKKRRLSSNRNITKSFLIVNYNFKVPTNISNLTNSKKLNNLAIGIEINNELDTFDGECSCDNKEIFSFLPIRSYGLKFILQADFELTASRESISIDSNWNIYIREIIPNALIHMISKLRETTGFHLLKKSFLGILPTKIDNIDEFFLPVISKINQALINEKCIYTYEKTFTQPFNSVFINKDSKIIQILLHIFPNINEFSYLLSKYSNKFLIYNVFTNNTENIILRDLGIAEFNINMLIDLIEGIISDYSYFGRSYEWYFNLFLLIENLIDSSENFNYYLQKLQQLPLFLTEEGRYIESIDINSKKKLFIMEEDVPSISKLGIHFIKKDFVIELKEFFKDELLNYNKVINFIQILGPSFLKVEEYYEIIYESLTECNLSTDDHIFFTFLLAKSNYNSINNKKIFAVNSNDELLPLSPRHFHLFTKDEKYSLIENINKIMGSQNRDLMNSFSHNKFNKRYLNYADVSFWNSYFSKFGVTILPFYFEQVQFGNLNEYQEYFKSCSKLNNELIKQHVESIHNINNSNCISVIDFYCHGIESLSIIMNDALLKNIGNKYFQELITTISNQVIYCVCDFWEEIQIYWSINIHGIIKKPSFVQLQFSSYPIFVSKYIFNNNFVFQHLCPPKFLTLYMNTQFHKVISKFVNFLILDNTEKNTSIILSDAFSSITEINLDYLCLLIETLHSPNYEKISLCNGDQIDPSSYISLLELIIKESKSNISMSSVSILKKNLLFPFQHEENLIWKNVQELYWDDENILPRNHSLFYQFSNIYKLGISMNDVLGFFLLLGVPINPEKNHLITYLLEIYKIKRIEVDSRILLTYVSIITQLYKTDTTVLKDLKLPIIEENNYCVWLSVGLIRDYNEVIFSDSISFHYFVYKLFPKKKVIWSPILFTFMHSNSNMDTLDIDALIHDWNIICFQLFKNSESLSLNSFPSNCCSLDSSFYYEIIVNLFGPLFEESIKNKNKTRKNWSKLILKNDIIVSNSNISIKYLEKTLNIPALFDIKTNKLYVKHQYKLENSDEIEEVLLSILTFISSFFPKNYPNIKCIMVTKVIFKDAVKEFKSSENNMSWDKFIINWIRKIEIEVGFKVDLKYFLLSDYVDNNASQFNNDVQLSEEFQMEHNTNCPKRIILEIGRIGEKLAFESLKEKFSSEIGIDNFNITWVNEAVESGLPYDIILVFMDKISGARKEIFVEVKSSSKKEKNFFRVSFNEWKFAEKLQSDYWLFHILGVNCNAPNLRDIEYRIIKNPYESWKDGYLKMILSEN